MLFKSVLLHTTENSIVLVFTLFCGIYLENRTDTNGLLFSC